MLEPARLAQLGFAALLAALLATLLGGCERARETGPVPFSPPQRICSITLATDEILARLVDPARVVAVSRFVDDPTNSLVPGHYPEGIPRVSAVIERILDLEPDLVLIGRYHEPGFLELLSRSDVNSLQCLPTDSISDILENVRMVGAAVGADREAEALIDEMERRLGALDVALVEAERPRVLYWSLGWTAGEGTSIDDVLVRAGATNVATELGISGHQSIGIERVIAADPDVLLLPQWTPTDLLPKNELPATLRELRACREGRVIHLDGCYINTVSHHIVAATEALARLIHPDRFEADQ